MTAAAHHPDHHEPGLESPGEIKAALLDVERDEFQRQYSEALAEALRALSLEPVHTMLASWRRIARQTQADPGAHRAMLKQAEHIMDTGEAPAGTVSSAAVRRLLSS